MGAMRKSQFKAAKGAGMGADELMLIDEVSAETRIPVGTLRWMRTKGEGPTAFRIGKRLVYRRRDVEAWLNAAYRAESSRASSARRGGRRRRGAA